ncbi:MAG: hypothetical protein HY917_04935 [Candidatus Diapherotrites archaeon]|nr:hypothetical protein [Candidatus Diapherotrites archaeon]
MRKYLHDYDHILQRELRLLDELKTSPRNKELILDYYNHKLSMGISLPRLIRILGSLRFTAKSIGKNFDQLDRKDYEKFVNSLRLQQYAADSIETFTSVDKNFHKWLNGGDTYPDCIRWFPVAFPEANPLEECWRQGKNNCLGSTFHQTFQEFKKTTQKYYRTKRFKLNLYKYLCH